MPTPATWQEKQAAKPDPIAAALQAFQPNGEPIPVRWPDTARDAMERAIEAYEAALELCRQCDEPGCTREASCGWPVSGVTGDGSAGYRRTCYDHWDRDAVTTHEMVV